MPILNEATIRNWFTSTKLTPDQQARYERAQAGCEGLARLLLEVCPKDNADRTAAMRSLRNLSMQITNTIAKEDL